MRPAAALIALLLLLALGPAPAAAQERRDVATWSGVWNETPITVTVIAIGHDIPADRRAGAPWWQWGNTESDAYLFSFGAPDEVELIIVFSREAGRPRATVYVLADDAQRRGVTLPEGRIVLPPDTHPFAIIEARRGEWLIDGQINFDLHVREFDENGAPSWEARVGGERPGLPSWMTRTLLNDPFPDRGIPRFGATVRADPSVIYQLATPLMPSWPLLSVVYGRDHWGDDRPMFYDPNERTLVMPWVGFQTAGVYNFNSLCYPPVVCFESPFAWYSFDTAAGRYANAMVRGDNWPAGVSLGPADPDIHRSTLRMSWTAEEARLWRYSLTVTGARPLDQRIAVGDEVVVYSIPYAELLPWIAGQEWRAVTFVEASEGEFGSEGIYDYSVEDNYEVAAWAYGETADPPTSFDTPLLEPASEQRGPRPVDASGERQQPQVSFRAPYLIYPHIHPNRLYEGFRGEYSMAFNRRPELYFSPIDNRAHLRYAEGGLWNLDNSTTLRSHNLGGGPLIDGWTRERVAAEPAATIKLGLPGAVEEAIYYLDGHLIYSGPRGAALRHAPDVVAEQPLPLPTDAGRWRVFLSGSAAAGQERDPWDLRGWLAAFSGPLLDLPGGAIGDVRHTSEGFRLALTVARAAPAGGLPGLPALGPGRYLLRYSRAAGAFRAEPLVPARLSLATYPQGALLEPGVEVRPNVIGVQVRNAGTADAHAVEVLVRAVGPDGAEREVAARRLDVPGEEVVHLRLPWTPPASGAWRLRVSVRNLGGPAEPQAMEETVMVAPVTLPSLGQAASGFGLVPLPGLASLAAAVMLLAGLSAAYLLAAVPAGGSEEHDGD